LRCLPYVQFGINKSGYKSNRYDAEVDKTATAAAGSVKYSPDLTSTQFQIEVPAKSGDLYVQVDLYPTGSVISNCRQGSYVTATKF